MKNEIRCAGGSCDASFAHDETCVTERGLCQELLVAAWVPVWIRVFPHNGSKMLFARGGWLCPACAEVLL